MKAMIAIGAILALPIFVYGEDVETGDEFEFEECILAHEGDCRFDDVFPAEQGPSSGWTRPTCSAACNEVNPNTWPGADQDGYICYGYSRVFGIPPVCRCLVICHAIYRPPNTW